MSKYSHGKFEFSLDTFFTSLWEVGSDYGNNMAALKRKFYINFLYIFFKKPVLLYCTLIQLKLHLFAVQRLILLMYFFLEGNFKIFTTTRVNNCRSSRWKVFLRKGVLKICSKFTGEHPWRSAINRTSAWVFSCKFAAYFQKNFS